jgi:glutamate synthase domain-containing protein 2/glutamate synthase domain-containing protein 1/glutamate synthase domain-containing protein 3
VTRSRRPVPQPEAESTRPSGRRGLYDPAAARGACGIAAVARLDGIPVHETVVRAIRALENLEHRGATGADPRTGDGAGILLQLPDELFRAEVPGLPPPGEYGVAVCFLPRDDPARRAELEALVERVVAEEGRRVVGWRDVPLELAGIGEVAAAAAPVVRQCVVAAEGLAGDALERKLYVIRRRAELEAGPDLVFPSFSSRTIVYKGMLMATQLLGAYPDLGDERVKSALALVHSRFSTNTFPSWELAHPYRMIAHNGEINTLRGNVNWMRARESQLRSDLFGDDLRKCLPVVREGGSDSANFDNVLELLVLAGRSLPHAMMMMIPEAYAGRDDVSDELRGFYDFHGCLMEPWDGPAAIAFTDGRVIGATLDRNGLRPGRWLETKDGWVVLASETGVLDVPAAAVARKGRLQPGKIFLVDLAQHRIVPDEELKREIATRRPYRAWFELGNVHLDDLPKREPRVPRGEPLRSRQLAFGYTQEDLKVILAPLARNAEEAIGSMGNDLALAVLSDQRPLLYSYFKQLFAQVTNPPIDSTREYVVMSVATSVGSERNLLDETPEHAHQLVIPQPILRNDELESLRQVDSSIFKAHTIDITWPAAEGVAGLERALERICAEADRVLRVGVNILILSDRRVSPANVPIPALLAVSAVHHHLVREGTRLQTGLVVESGEPRETHHFATLIGYGAAAVNPYVMLETLDELVDAGVLDLTREEAQARAIKGIGKALLKTISKMGISTISSYCGAQIFEAVGLARALVDRHFTGTPSRIEGVGLEVLAREALDRHARAYGGNGAMLPLGGVYAWRADGERHQWNPETIALLQHAVRHGGWPTYEEYARAVNDDAARRATLRGLLEFRFPEDGGIPLEEVEPAAEIVKRFSTGAMSLGSLSREMHETLAIAMNRIGGKSNTGEGGEDPVRYVPEPNGDSRRSAIKQVASGRFGVNIHYLVNADQLQIKMAQGAKPGEGGQLPGHKVDAYIAKIRFTTPGVGLISPPPHHDIYSIEDLKQLIYDLRCANPEAQVSVKLVAEFGVGTVAAGVAKANADHVLISGHDGGTGASPLSSIQCAGIPWEIGLAETQQTLVANDLRSRIWVQTDGQLKTGRDVVVAALLGADEMGFSTAPLIASGCIMMRACHLNTCPVGIATQDPELRARFAGQPEHVVNFFFFVAEEVRRIMARLGVRRFEDLVGRVDLLSADAAVDHWKARGVDLSPLLAPPPPGAPLRRLHPPESPLPGALDWRLIELAQPAIERGERVEAEVEVRNVHRAVGGLLSSAVTRKHGAAGLPEGTIRVTLRGSAGQSFGAWLAPGIELTLYGDANDYAGKGLSGGVIALRPPEDATFPAEDNVIVGNTVLYGATAGRAFFRGLAGERFAVRNSGASAVVEGVGDHGCEYMTGGRVVVLGKTGRNFAAGMSGGIAYVLDVDGRFERRCNMELVGFDPIDEEDAETIRALVAEHAERTGSPVAARVLERWDETLPRFVKVMPHDYKRALAELAEGEISYPDEHPVSSGGEGFLITETEAPAAA